MANGSIVPTDELAAAVKRCLDADGETLTCQRLQLSRIAVSKLAGGLPVRRGTAALAALKLGLVSQLTPDIAGEVVGD